VAAGADFLRLIPVLDTSAETSARGNLRSRISLRIHHMAADYPSNPPTRLHQLYLCGLGSSAVGSHVVPALAWRRAEGGGLGDRPRQ
jgi:hypothetical protein